MKNNSKIQIDPKNLMAIEHATTALIGTSISLIILGFVFEKFELFLHLIIIEFKEKSESTIPHS